MKKKYVRTSIFEDHINSDMPLIEKMFSYSPDYRPGYGEGKREERIKNNLAKNFYSKRVSISESIVQNRLHHESPREILIAALIENRMPPSVFTVWIDYIQFLSDRYGGWDLFIQELADSIYQTQYIKDKIKNYFIFNITLYFSLVMLNSTTTLYDGNIKTIVALGLMFVFTYIFVVHSSDYFKHKKFIFKEVSGDSGKRVKDFIKETIVKSYIKS